ncbi:MAG: acyl-CoA thioesterase [bacterium]
MDRGITFFDSTLISVRYSYVDRMKFVYHVHYLEFFEWARSDWMKKFWKPYREIEEQGDALVVVEARIRYLRPAFYDDLLLTFVRPYDWGRSRLEFEYLIKRSGEEESVCRGHTIHCYVGSDGKPKPFPTDLREVLEKLAQKFSSQVNFSLSSTK